MQNGTNMLNSSNVAQARWDLDQQAWVWSAMDLGVSFPGYPSRVDSLAIRPSNSPNGFDVIVAGFFTQAGLVGSTGTARWVVSDTDCTNSRPPSVYFLYMPDGSTFPNTAPVLLQVQAVASDGAQIQQVDFYADGCFITNATQNPGYPIYSEWWHITSGVTDGFHQLDAVAIDDQGLTNKATVTVAINPTGGPSLAPSYYMLRVFVASYFLPNWDRRVSCQVAALAS